MSQPFSLDRLFRFLSPEVDPDSASTSPEKINKKIERLLIEAKGNGYSWDKIVTEIDSYLNKDTEATKLVRRNFRILGPKSGKKSLLNEGFSYFDRVADIESVVPNISSVSAGNKSVSVFAIRDSQVSPGSAGCDKVGRFLNYTPSFVASQMMPYLEVELRIEGGSNYTRNPGILRFLLGSREAITLGSSNRTLYSGDRLDKDGKTTTGENVVYTRSGMEMFLMPQTLTNMNTLKPGPEGSKARLVPVKPFLPLASLEGFDVTLRNSGSKTYVHKTAVLKMKIHDKARISELEEFVRGGDGFRRVTLVTRYGWHAPKNTVRRENQFFDFINKEMQTVDYWTVTNSQFSFDSTGQVNVGLQLVSAAVRYGSESNIVQGDEDKDVKTFNDTVAKINASLDVIREKGGFPANVTIAQTLNDAALKGIYSNKDSTKVLNSIKDFEKSLIARENQNNPLIPADEREKLIEALKSLNKGAVNPNKKAKAQPSLYERGQRGAIATAEKKLEEITVNKIDPWLPREGSDLGFNGSLIKEVASFGGSNVASFAKVMLTFAKGLVTNDVDEVQFVFYPINSQAGYAGRVGEYDPISLAEYPIDINVLKASYRARVKELNTTVLSLEEFFRLVVDLNFTDARGIGFGKRSFYSSINADKPSEPAKVPKEKASLLKDWEDKNPNFTIPIIDMVVRLETDLSEAGTPRVIKKIYFYDRQNVLYEDVTNMTIEQKKQNLEKGVPLITIGTNGSLVLNSSVTSKTDGSQQAVYIARSLQTNPLVGKINPTADPVEDPDNQLPIRTLPVQFTMTTLGCPLAALYQQYFVDFFTGTSLDNLYMCTQAQHSISSGKYVTTWTFMQSNGYSKFVKPVVPAPVETKIDPKKTVAEDKKAAKGKPSTKVSPKPGEAKKSAK